MDYFFGDWISDSCEKIIYINNMSNYYFEARNKATGETYSVLACDNYFGSHKYGYKVNGEVLNKEDFERLYDSEHLSARASNDSLLDNMNEKEISDYFVRWLEPYGIIKWHKNSNHSFYLKFKDARLGSIRIANHKGRDRYNYTYEVYRNEKNLEEKMKSIVDAIAEKSATLSDFDPDKYVVWDKKRGGFKAVENYKQYKLEVFGKGNRV